MITVRVWFSKRGEACYISHLDMQRVMHRVLRKAKIPAWYSQGFNPHIYLTFALPLPLGQESICEYLDFKTEQETPDLDNIFYALKDILPSGIEIYNVTIAKHKAGEIAFSRYLVTFPNEIKQQAIEAVNQYNLREIAVTTKMGKQRRTKVEKEIDLKQFIKTLDTNPQSDDFCLDLLLPAGSVSINPALILKFLSSEYNLDCSAVNICRTQVLIKNMEKFD